MAKPDLTSQSARTLGSGKYRRIRVGHPVSSLCAETHLSETFPIFFQRAVVRAEAFAGQCFSGDFVLATAKALGLKDRGALFSIGLDRSEQRALYGVYLQHASFLLMTSRDALVRTLSYQYAARSQQELSWAFFQLSPDSRRRLFYAGSESFNHTQQNAWKRACSGALAVARLMSALREMDAPLAFPTVQLDAESGIDLITPPYKRQQGICWQVKCAFRNRVKILDSEYGEADTESEELAVRTWRGVRHFNQFYNLQYAAVLAFVGGSSEGFSFESDTELQAEIYQCLDALARPPIFSMSRDALSDVPSV